MPLQNLEHVCLPLRIATAFATASPLRLPLLAGWRSDAPVALWERHKSSAASHADLRGGSGALWGVHLAANLRPSAPASPHGSPWKPGSPLWGPERPAAAHSPPAVANAVARQWRTQWQTTMANRRVRSFAMANCFSKTCANENILN